MDFRLKELRETRKWSQEELGARCNTSFQNISRWETGSRGKQMAQWLPRFSAALDVEIWELFASREQIMRKLFSPDDQEILTACRNMSPGQKKAETDNESAAAAKQALLKRTTALREKAGCTQAEMADAMGVPRETWATYEYRTPLKHSLIPRFCEIVGVSAGMFLTGRPGIEDYWMKLPDTEKAVIARMIGLPPLPEKESLHAPPEAAMKRED